MPQPISLEQIVMVSRAIDPVANVTIDALEQELGGLPAGYREVLARFGCCSGRIGLGFVGDLSVLAPDHLRVQREQLTDYFSAPPSAASRALSCNADASAASNGRLDQ